MPGPDDSASSLAAERLRTTTNPDLHLRVAGKRIDPEMRGHMFVFHLVLPCGDVQLVSRHGRPYDLGINGDIRRLGVRLSALVVVQGDAETPIPLDHPALRVGLHPIEEGEARWTQGVAELPAMLFPGIAGAAELHIAASPLQAYRAEPDDSDRLFERFTALGDDCEFGLVQREFGAEPLDLLRWAGTDIARLVLGLCRRFEGLGDPAHTTLEFRPDQTDYRLRDARYLSMHTWVMERLASPDDEEEMRRSGAARLRLMRRKLLAEIEEGRRILVFASSRYPLQQDTLRALHAAVRGVGPAPLLCVVAAPSPEQIGRVESLGDGLFVGYLDQFKSVETGFSFATWRRICQQAAALIDGAAAEPQGAQP